MDGCSDNAAEKLACSIKRSEVPLIIAVVASLCPVTGVLLCTIFFFFSAALCKKDLFKGLG